MTDGVGRRWYGRVVEKTLDRLAADYGIRIPLDVMAKTNTKARIQGIFATLAKTPGIVTELQFIREPNKLRAKRSKYVQSLIDAGVMVSNPKKKQKKNIGARVQQVVAEARAAVEQVPMPAPDVAPRVANVWRTGRRAVLNGGFWANPVEPAPEPARMWDEEP